MFESQRDSCLCALLCGAVGLFAVPMCLSAQASLQVVAAEPADGGQVKFTIDNFAWQASAPSGLRRHEGVPLSPGLLKGVRSENAGAAYIPFHFWLPTPDSLRSRSYLLVHAGGLTALRLDSLRGTALAFLSDADSGYVVGPVRFSGEAYAARTSGAGSLGGGFVLITQRPLHGTITPSARTADELLGPNGVDSNFRGTPFWSIQRQFTFRLPDDPAPYVFVQWAPDEAGREAGCQYRFALFRLGPAPRQVANISYGCDV